MIYLGIDIAKKSHRFCLLDEHGERIGKNWNLDSRQDGFDLLLKRLQEIDQDPAHFLIGMEATGIFWENLYTFLTEKKYKVILLNPHQTNKFREALRKKAKTDDIDALVIAALLRSGEYRDSYITEESVQSLRDLVKFRYALQKDLKNYQRQATSLLQLVFPEYEDIFKNPFSISGIAVFSKWPTAIHLKSASVNAIERVVRKIQGNHLSKKQIQQLLALAKNSIYSGKAHQARGLSLKILLQHIQQLKSSLAELESQIEQILQPPDDASSGTGENVLSIPGVGPKTLAAVLAETGIKGERFPSGTQFVGHIGFFPNIYQSGETKRDNKLSSRGPKHLRQALYMAAVACLLHNPQLKSLYKKKISQGKKPKQALICVAVKLAHMILHLLKSGETYDPARVFVGC